MLRLLGGRQRPIDAHDIAEPISPTAVGIDMSGGALMRRKLFHNEADGIRGAFEVGATAAIYDGSLRVFRELYPTD